jgi:hypothetical protein
MLSLDALAIAKLFASHEHLLYRPIKGDAIEALA